MNILLLGSGGREHAIAWKLTKSKHLTKLFIAPGNAGTSACGENLNLDVNDFHAIKKAVLDFSIDMVVVGPEEPLVKGIKDFFLNDSLLKHISIVGPSKAGAALEGSKKFAKEFMLRHNIPTARHLSVTLDTMDEGFEFLKELNPPYVLKADGLAAGKGVIIVNSRSEADLALMVLLKGKFGKASQTVVIEEFLNGIELSVFVLTDGKNYKILPEAKDYKRIGEGDTGLNTGGMGAVSPVPFADESFMSKVEKQIIIPTIDGLIKENIDYNGFIFFGLMNLNGYPFVIEYNVRLGDPETEVVIPRIKTDLVELFKAVINKNLHAVDIEIDNRTATTVMLVSGGYPEDYKKGKNIQISNMNDSIIFHAGTTQKNNTVITNGGRVIAVTSYGNSIEEALSCSYSNIQKIWFEDMYYRKDIGFDLKNKN